MAIVEVVVGFAFAKVVGAAICNHHHDGGSVYYGQTAAKFHLHYQ